MTFSNALSGWIGWDSEHWVDFDAPVHSSSGPRVGVRGPHGMSECNTRKLTHARRLNDRSARIDGREVWDHVLRRDFGGCLGRAYVLREAAVPALANEGVPRLFGVTSGRRLFHVFHVDREHAFDRDAERLHLACPGAFRIAASGNGRSVFLFEFIPCVRQSERGVGSDLDQAPPSVSVENRVPFGDRLSFVGADAQRKATISARTLVL